MKKEFSTAWKASKQPRKQIKYLAKAPLHINKKLMNVNLGKELRKKTGKRNIPVRKGDTVKILRGKFKGKKEKINRVDAKKYKLFLDNVVFEKKDGTKVPIGIHYSNVQIWELNLNDKKRVASLNKKGKKVK